MGTRRETAWRRLAVVAVAGLVAAGCGSGSQNPVIDTVKVGDPCDQYGAVSCGEDHLGRSVLVQCAPDGADAMAWKLDKVCPYGCEDGACLAQPADVPDAGGDLDASGDRTADDQDSAATETPGELPGDLDVEAETDVVCVPKCEGMQCGLDGCGGKCGECPEGQVCLGGAGTCCTPDCFGKLCGDDGCQGQCGKCPEGMECKPFFQCGPICAPKCDGKECGPDSCGGSCGDCPPGKACGPDDLCSICIPQCEGKECGDDTCGGKCGGCAYGFECEDYKCTKICVPTCPGTECGSDGCGGSCGDCMPGETCIGGQCVIVCEPECAGKECGADGCGGSCGKCPPWAWCSAQGTCVTDCVPDCTDKKCGSDQCGGTCGMCPGAKKCAADGQCHEEGGPCGSVDASGWCDGPFLVTCINGVLDFTDCLTAGKNVVCEWMPALNAHACNPHGECVPSCYAKECGDDGCGGVCGTCKYGMQCVDGYCIGQGPCGDIGFEGCCNENSVYWCDNGTLWHMDCGTMASPAQQFCGWNAEFSFFDCVDAPHQPPGAIPFYCQGACVPNCANKQCGSDGCGGSCGECPEGTQCKDYQCKGAGGECGGYGPEPVCQGDTVVWCENDQLKFQDCTANGQYWHCGWVPNLFVNACYKEECISDCEGKECGDDGCGYVCGYCPVTQYCNDIFQCIYGQGFCGDVDYIGLCEGNKVKWCQNGILQVFDCMNLGPEWQCGWYEKGGYYWCVQK